MIFLVINIKKIFILYPNQMFNVFDILKKLLIFFFLLRFISMMNERMNYKINLPFVNS